MAGHVVLYQYNETTQAWDLKKVEGSLFVVARVSEPRHMFVVLNRLSSQNVVEAITADFQMELTDQFLLYRNEKAEIIGIWFYSTPERTEIADLLQSIIAGQEPDTSATVNEPAANAASSMVDTSAESTPASVPPPAASTSDPVSGEVATASNNVAAFFTMMQGQLPAAGAAVPPTPTGTTDASSTTQRASEPGQSQTATNGGVSSGDVIALKVELRGRLLSLLDDDAFLETLAREFLSQQQSAAQAQTSGGTGRNRSRGKANQTPATRAPLAPAAEASSSSDVPAHLLALLQQQQLSS